MSFLKMNLTSDNFDICRICLLEPDSNRDVKFLDIFSSNTESLVLSVKIKELFGIIVDMDDFKPKIICQHCYKSILDFVKLKEEAIESQNTINEIVKLRYATTPGSSSLPQTSQVSSNTTYKSTHSRNTNLSTNSFTRSSSKSPISNNSMSKLNLTQNNVSQLISINQLPMSLTDDQPSVFVDNTFFQTISCDSESDNESIQNFNSKNKPNKNNVKISNKTYCSICKEKKFNNHDCSEFNKEFSSCLAPYCNILFRSAKDFLLHYQQHICKLNNETSTNKESEKSEYSENSRLLEFCGEDLNKCFICNVNFDNTSKLAFHKLKTHNARLKNSLGHYLCLFCEKSSSDLIDINEHIKHCRENPTDAVYEHNIKLDDKNISFSSKNTFFTCTEPCNLIFDNISHYKSHYCEHFGINEDLMCWRCFSPFSKSIYLHAHQKEGKCQTPRTFKCFECSEKYNDLQSLGIHKMIHHNGQFISDIISIKCVYCKVEISVLDLKSHFKECQLQKNKKSIKTFTCAFCYNEFRSGAALTSHIKTHLSKDWMKPKKNSISKKRKCELTDTIENIINSINMSPSSSQSNGSIRFDDYDMNSTRIMEEEI